MFNKVILIGNLTRDVELRYTGSGSAVAKFGLAVNRTWKDRNSGEKREEVCYVDINIFGRSAEVANQHLGKGRRVLIEGRLTFEQWQDQNGQKRSKHSISAESFQFLDARGEGGNTGGGYNNQQNDYGQRNNAPQNDSPFDTESSSNSSSNMGNIDIDDDDIPF
jgi:single-strand DNA-binding protein